MVRDKVVYIFIALDSSDTIDLLTEWFITSYLLVVLIAHCSVNLHIYCTIYYVV